MRGIEIDSPSDIRSIAIFNVLINERNLAYKISELRGHCAGTPNVENLNKCISELHEEIYPWIKLNNNEKNKDLIDILREYK